jgi:UDP-N-acetylmuramyl pentapeptide phosphotransferase/UDP-N-acetylglucosamine-1-phosphate transferase
LLLIIFLAGTANFYNFMDRINGIAGITGLIGFGFLALHSFQWSGGILMLRPFGAINTPLWLAVCLGGFTLTSLMFRRRFLT